MAENHKVTHDLLQMVRLALACSWSVRLPSVFEIENTVFLVKFRYALRVYKVIVTLTKPVDCETRKSYNAAFFSKGVVCVQMYSKGVLSIKLILV